MLNTIRDVLDALEEWVVTLLMGIFLVLVVLTVLLHAYLMLQFP